MDKYREALESMVFQFGHRGTKNGKPTLYTGGLSALEQAFEALGWDEPYYLPEEGYTCEVEGCMEIDVCGYHWGVFYLRLCAKHFRDAKMELPCPKIKIYAIERENKRDPVTHILKG
jgi:hypothetical protein